MMVIDRAMIRQLSIAGSNTNHIAKFFTSMSQLLC